MGTLSIGCEIIIADRWYPSSKTCSNCGHKKEELSLSQRTYHCDNCGFEMDRDLNAAINLSPLATACKLTVACFPQGGITAPMLPLK